MIKGTKNRIKKIHWMIILYSIPYNGKIIKLFFSKYIYSNFIFKFKLNILKNCVIKIQILLYYYINTSEKIKYKDLRAFFTPYYLRIFLIHIFKIHYIHPVSLIIQSCSRRDILCLGWTKWDRIRIGLPFSTPLTQFAVFQ